MPEEIPKLDLRNGTGRVPGQDASVSFDTGRKEEIKITDAELQKTDLGEVAGWLEQYNKQFHFGTLLAKKLMRSWEDKPDADSTQTVEEEKSISFEEITKRNQKTLTQTGLSLEPVRAIGMIMSEDGVEYPSELRINLSSGAQFVRYLHSLKGNLLSPSQKIGLEQTAISLAAQLQEQYDLANPEDDRLLQLFGSASKIILEYERLDTEGGTELSASIAELKNLVAIAKQGYLREHLLAEKGQLLAEVGGHNFGPSMWHRDSSEKNYIKMWNKALATLSRILESPKTQRQKHFTNKLAVTCWQVLNTR